VPAFVYTDEVGRRQSLTLADVIHVPGPLSLDGLRGCSPVRYCRAALATAASITDHADATWASGGLPPGVLKVPPSPNADEQMANLDVAWHKRQRGRVAVLQGDISFERLGLSNEDSQFIESANWSSQAVARMFGLPPWAIFAPAGDSLTYSTVEGQLKALVTFSLAPWFVSVEDAFTGQRRALPRRLLRGAGRSAHGCP
jgi:HK97 family phage portal protein